MIPRLSPDYRMRDLVRAFLPQSATTVRRLERRFAERCEHADALALRYGRSGLYYLLLALRTEQRRVVVMPSYTCVVVAHAVVRAGYTPRFVDNATGSFQPNPEDLFAAVSDDTAMVIPTHLFGLSQMTSALCKELSAKRPDVFILQDCAHGFFCAEGAATCASLGDGALFGTNISKLVNSVKGGVLTLKNPDLSARTRALAEEDARQFGSTSPALRQFLLRSYVWAAGLGFTPPGYTVVDQVSRRTSLLRSETEYFQPDTVELPHDFRGVMNGFEAATALASLERYDTRVARRRQLAQIYDNRLQPLARRGLLVLPPLNSGDSYSHYPVLISALLRNKVQRLARADLGCELGTIVNYGVADLPSYSSAGHASCPRALDAAQRVINLPLTFSEGLWPARRWRCRAEAVADWIASQVEGTAHNSGEA